MVMPKEEAKQFKPLPEDVYTVELFDVNAKEVETIDSKQARLKDDMLAPLYETVLDFQFVLLEGQDGAEDLRGRNLFQKYVPSHLYISAKGKNKLFQITEALQGESLSLKQEAEGITGRELNAFVGKQCRVTTENKMVGDKTYSNIKAFLVSKGVYAKLTQEELENAKIKPRETEEAKKD